MERKEFVELIEANPVVAAIKDESGLKRCLASDISVVFILCGDVITVREIVRRIKESGKTAIVHIDLISGLAQKEVSVDFIREYTEADGIISTKVNLIRRAKAIGMRTILRYFMIDSLALQNVEKQAQSDVQPDIIELLPGILVPEFIERVRKICRVPIMASGLITDKREILAALNAGAIAISTTDQEIWFQ